MNDLIQRTRQIIDHHGVEVEGCGEYG